MQATTIAERIFLSSGSKAGSMDRSHRLSDCLRSIPCATVRTVTRPPLCLMRRPARHAFVASLTRWRNGSSSRSCIALLHHGGGCLDARPPHFVRISARLRACQPVQTLPHSREFLGGKSFCSLLFLLSALLACCPRGLPSADEP